MNSATETDGDSSVRLALASPRSAGNSSGGARGVGNQAMRNYRPHRGNTRPTPRAAEPVTRETFLATAERIADEIIAQRKPRGGMRQRLRPRTGSIPLFRAANGGSHAGSFCAGSNAGAFFCWEPDCERCKPA